jgi:superfamily I DNA/RNA helicase
MGFGVPEEWVDDVRAADEDTLFDVIPHLPQEAQEALLKLAVGETPEPPKPTPATADPFAHPDAQRRFRVLTNIEELERALNSPWEKWAVFLHPDQRQYAEKNYAGPARVTGSAGTGKTIVALHRAVYLARSNPNAQVLLTTFSEALARSLKIKLDHLVGNEPSIAPQVHVQSIRFVGRNLYSSLFGEPNIASSKDIKSLLATAAEKTEGHKFSLPFLIGEWTDVVDSWQLKNWEAYRDVTRLGRKTRIGGKQREILWSIFEAVRSNLNTQGLVTWADIFGRVADCLSSTTERPFDFAIVDEAQDLGVTEARFLSVLAGGKTNGIFFAGDLGQRIFQQPFSWKSLGIDVRGKSFTLKVNYRTSHQIRAHADLLLPSSVADVDGNTESRRGTVSVFDGQPPEAQTYPSAEAEQIAVGRWIAARLQSGCLPHEIGVFVRSDAEIDRAKAAIQLARIQPFELTDTVAAETGRVAVSTMHLAKGLEFRAVAVMACDEDVIPSQQRIEDIADDADLQEVYDTERHLLYVACTRARDYLLVTGIDPGSEFLADLTGTTK